MKTLNRFLKTPLRAQSLQLAGVVCASVLLALVLVPRDARCRSFDKDSVDEVSPTQEFQLEVVSVTRDGVPVESVQWPAVYKKASVNFTHECDEKITSVTLLSDSTLMWGAGIRAKGSLEASDADADSRTSDAPEAE